MGVSAHGVMALNQRFHGCSYTRTSYFLIFSPISAPHVGVPVKVILQRNVGPFRELHSSVHEFSIKRLCDFTEVLSAT